MDKWLSHPTALKIISVILGLLLWAVVHIDPQTSPQQITSNIDTKVIEAATIVPIGLDEKKYVLTAMEPTVARIVVEGRITNLYAATNEDYVVNVDLTNARAGIQVIPLTVKMPRGIKEVELSPRKVTVRLEEIVSKSFDVQVITEGKPAPGYVLGTPEILSENSDVVQVTLPKDDMLKVGVVAVKVNVEGENKTMLNKKAKIVVYDTEGQEIENAKVEPSTLQVETKITLPFKQVPLQVRYTGSLPQNLGLVSVTPVTDEVTVYAEQNILDNLQIFDGVVLDLTKVKQSGRFKVKASPIDGIQSVAPDEIELDVVVETATTRVLKGIPILINGTTGGMSAQVVTPDTGTLDLEISGASAALAKVKLTDITIVAQVAGLAAGTHTVPLELELPPHVQPVLTGGQPLTVTVEIKDDSTSTEQGNGGEDTGVGGTPTPTPTPTDPPEGNTEQGEGSGNNGGASNGAENATPSPSNQSGNARNSSYRNNAITIYDIRNMLYPII
ncbi:YbbR-like domain-containing protein [Paenibacillus sp. L3-i20]|uniref:CdaR family protein n=1 Tax=Paenibacillus sp. L3-i20 TaxID=2905833 RepID=UPI001EDCCE45|nr:CdaR family protein [Paenibacillus sp. L3-i20]GKU76643.1 hypothetical protein L3i20_v210400 [Paenibacillus sp. L3-i20]